MNKEEKQLLKSQGEAMNRLANGIERSRIVCRKMTLTEFLKYVKKINKQHWEIDLEFKAIMDLLKWQK